MLFDISLGTARALWTVQLDYFIGFFTLGWLAAPLIYLLHLCWSCVSRDANPGRGDWCRSRGGWGCFGSFVCYGARVNQCL